MNFPFNGFYLIFVVMKLISLKITLLFLLLSAVCIAQTRHNIDSLKKSDFNFKIRYYNSVASQ